MIVRKVVASAAIAGTIGMGGLALAGTASADSNWKPGDTVNNSGVLLNGIKVGNGTHFLNGVKVGNGNLNGTKLFNGNTFAFASGNTVEFKLANGNSLFNGVLKDGIGSGNVLRNVGNGLLGPATTP